MKTVKEKPVKKKRKYVYSGKYSKGNNSVKKEQFQQKNEESKLGDIKYYPIGEFFRVYKNESGKWKVEFVLENKWYSTEGEYEDFYDSLIGITRIGTSISM